jgi:ubiquinone/menaquinone biosynthesis C-methylase UbiE
MVDRDAVRRGYDDLAETYAATRSEADPGTAVLDEFLDTLPASPHVLDAGCGQGTPVLARVSRTAAATGLDFSLSQLALAAARVPDATLTRGDMTRLPFREGVFDAVTAFHSLIHVPLDEHQSTLDEFARVLRPAGRVLLTEGQSEWCGTNPDWLDTGVEMQWHIAGVDATRDHLRRAGFTVTDEWDRTTSREDDEEHWVYLAARLDS